jgi:hypothetical protein
MSKMGTEALRLMNLEAMRIPSHDYEEALEKENERLRWQVRLMVGEREEIKNGGK